MQENASVFLPTTLGVKKPKEKKPGEEMPSFIQSKDLLVDVTNKDEDEKKEERKEGEFDKLSASRQGSVGSNDQFDTYTNEIYDGL